MRGRGQAGVVRVTVGWAGMGGRGRQHQPRVAGGRAGSVGQVVSMGSGQAGGQVGVGSSSCRVGGRAAVSGRAMVGGWDQWVNGQAGGGRGREAAGNGQAMGQAEEELCLGRDSQKGEI